MGQSKSSEAAPLLPLRENPGVGIQNPPNYGNRHPEIPRAWNGRHLVSCIIMGIFTGWPWKVAAYITRDSQSKECPCFSCLQWFYIAVRLLLAVMGLIVQELICFRRDRLDQNTVQQNNGSKVVECDEASRIFSDYVVPDTIILLALAWLLLKKFLEKFCNACGSKKLTDTGIINLVNRIESQKKPDIYMWIIFPTLVFVYMILSQGVSIMNMYAFDIEGNDVTIHGRWTNISGSQKKILTILSFLGFLAIDLFYTQLILKYAFECKMNIYFLEEIKKKINNSEVIREGHAENGAENDNVGENERNYAYTDQNEALSDVKDAHNFLNQLNSNATVVGYIILIIIFLATNCIVSLLNEGNTIFQEAALTARLLQWISLTLFALFQAAQVNKASKNLYETGLPIYRPPVRFRQNTNHQNTMIKEHASRISLKAKLFGFTIHPVFPYVIIILTLFTLMVGSGYKWYEVLLPH